MKKAAFVLWQCIWGLPQTLLGCMLFLACSRYPRSGFHGAVAVHWPQGRAVSLGLFLFAGLEGELLVHEYGHSLQSLLLGPLYLPVILLPSMVWAGLPALGRWRQQKCRPYAWLYTESWANRLGEWATGQPSIGNRA